MHVTLVKSVTRPLSPLKISSAIKDGFQKAYKAGVGFSVTCSSFLDRVEIGLH